MRTPLALACAILLASACDATERDVRPSPGVGATPSPTVTGAPSPSPSGPPGPDLPPEPTIQLPKDAPTTVDEPDALDRIAAGDREPLAPPGATVSLAEILETPEDRLDQIAFAWRRGEDPFASEHGFSVWQRFENGPAWRVVYAFTDPPSAGVLGVGLEAGDLTADGLPELLTFEQVGGTGACGTWRVISPATGSAMEILRRATCDVEIAIVDGGLRVETAVYRPDDPHCCPSAFRITRLEWDGGTFVRTERQLVEAPT